MKLKESFPILVILFDLDSDLKQRFICSYFVFVVCFGAHDVMNKSYQYYWTKFNQLGMEKISNYLENYFHLFDFCNCTILFFPILEPCVHAFLPCRTNGASWELEQLLGQEDTQLHDLLLPSVIGSLPFIKW